MDTNKMFIAIILATFINILTISYFINSYETKINILTAKISENERKIHKLSSEKLSISLQTLDDLIDAKIHDYLLPICEEFDVSIIALNTEIKNTSFDLDEKIFNISENFIMNLNTINTDIIALKAEKLSIAKKDLIALMYDTIKKTVGTVEPKYGLYENRAINEIKIRINSFQYKKNINENFTIDKFLQQD
jgi:hypothetical protein